MRSNPLTQAIDFASAAPILVPADRRHYLPRPARDGAADDAGCRRRREREAYEIAVDLPGMDEKSIEVKVAGERRPGQDRSKLQEGRADCDTAQKARGSRACEEYRRQGCVSDRFMQTARAQAKSVAAIRPAGRNLALQAQRDGGGVAAPARSSQRDKPVAPGAIEHDPGKPVSTFPGKDHAR